MSKLFWILAAVAALVVIAFGYTGAGAWFTDQTHSSGYILAAASLDLQVTGGPLKAKNLSPGMDYTRLGGVCVRNVGDVTLKYRGQFESTLPLSGDLLRYTTMLVEQKSRGKFTIVKEIPGRAALENESLPYYFKFPGQDPGIDNLPIMAGTLAPKERFCYRLSVKLDGDTPNDLQGQSIRFILRVDATQMDNPAWQ